MPPDPDEEDEISTKPGQDQPHQWVIKRRQAALDTYMYGQGVFSLDTPSG
jgi:hypothetical protein